jgi:large subunit ribosomal protein L25
MESIILKAQRREATGKQVKRLRLAGQVPAVVYGHGVEPYSITVEARALETAVRKAGESTLIDLEVEGMNPVKVLLQELQHDARKNAILHADLRQVNLDEKINTEIPLSFEGESTAVKLLGGTLVRRLDSLEVSCLPTALVHEIKVPLSRLATLSDVITVADLEIPAGIEVMNEPGQAVVMISAAMTEAEMAALEAASGADVSAVKVAGDEKKAEKEEAK